ncbi:MAG: zinc-binding alcohol dehydrogenase family protein [Chloroflexota bacterium]|nr:zinc-binding alcohol dehydrogenase family protein [Chloroflexota bacterium]
MRNVAVCGSKVKSLVPYNDSIETIEIEGIPVTCGIIPSKETDPDFDKKAPQNRFNVLVKIRSFSCNYRDKALVFAALNKGGERSFYVVGSEFVSEVVDVGSEVTGFEIGDKVIGNNHYTGAGPSVNGVFEGLPTNHASKEYQVFHQAKLIKVPRKMPDEVAAAFSIGAQTAYSMIRKLNVTEGSNVLITAAKSNTSLFAINALKKHNVNIYATTTSMRFEKELKEMGVKELFQIDPTLESFTVHKRINKIAMEIGQFDCVFDPFFDLHLGKVIDVMAPGGRYVTCGLCNQYQSLIGQEFHYRGRDLQGVLALVISRNLQIIGNCIGLTEDLNNALKDYSSGRLDVVIDSVFSGNQVGAFFDRTYNVRERFGKVVYKYE